MKSSDSNSYHHGMRKYIRATIPRVCCVSLFAEKNSAGGWSEHRPEPILLLATADIPTPKLYTYLFKIHVASPHLNNWIIANKINTECPSSSYQSGFIQDLLFNTFIHMLLSFHREHVGAVNMYCLTGGM